MFAISIKSVFSWMDPLKQISIGTVDTSSYNNELANRIRISKKFAFK
ncbi:hypothetical protein [Candidatus Riesia pediculischaeffi]|uniref:Uncharacterized protein n=1 Tax=Candidatus Riesia pediculischaeffi PTSU TaxID=1401651 RepID=A0A0C1S0Z2_9ENTR|nr:hypothetical protein [Candidatus Riesia pediculischaeffi]KIE64232.1 hypothetical protein P689_119203 [Candidatus Riesia pediculischaeffi PTSU]